MVWDERWHTIEARQLQSGLGRYETALVQAQQASEQAPELYISMWAQPELIEAASRAGQTRLAADALGRLAEATSVGQTDWGQGICARSRAVVSDGPDAERWYRQAVGRLGRTSLRPELARAHLLYGEWLRRQHRRTDARAQLRAAHDMFATIGMQAFAERARRELLTAGEAVRARTAGPRDQLTPRRPRSPGWPGRACPTRRSPPSCSCPHGQSKMASAQGIHQARDHLPPAAPASTARQRPRRADGLMRQAAGLRQVGYGRGKGRVMPSRA